MLLLEVFHDRERLGQQLAVVDQRRDQRLRIDCRILRLAVIAPREVHEGLAQVMEGKRLESVLDREGRKALADGRIRGVEGFYLGALSLAEFLIAERGQGGINDLLQAMGDTGNVDLAFQKVFSRSYAEVQKDWAVRLERQYGS